MKISKVLKKIYNTNVDLFRRLWEQSCIHRRAREIDITNLYNEVHQHAAPCFVLSTGRCGTKLLTEILQKSTDIDPVHVPTPELTYYSEVAYRKAHSDPDLINKIVDTARYEQIRDAWLLQKKYVETNNRITFFCHALADLYPNSTFIHLVRKPEEFITSGLARNWYSGSVLHDEGRITPEDKELNQAEKIAWLWNETNSFIEEFKEVHSSDRVFTVLSEDLFKLVEASQQIFEYLSLEPPKRSILRKLIAKPINQQSKENSLGETITWKLLEKYAPLRSHYFNGH